MVNNFENNTEAIAIGLRPISNGMKKLLFVALIATLGFTVAACQPKKQVATYDVAANGVMPTGRTIDITELNGATGTSTPGDVYYIKLVAQSISGKQWSFASPTSGEPFMLTKHEASGYGDKTATTTIDEWWLKVEQAGNFHLQFNYGKPLKKPEKIFSYDIVSQ